jgi:hypothetical protein
MATLDLDRVQAELESTTQVLSDTEKLLEETRVDLEDHKLILQEHTEAEAKFHTEVDLVMKTLQETVGDIQGLREKIGT